MDGWCEIIFFLNQKNTPANSKPSGSCFSGVIRWKCKFCWNPTKKSQQIPVLSMHTFGFINSSEIEKFRVHNSNWIFFSVTLYFETVRVSSGCMVHMSSVEVSGKPLNSAWARKSLHTFIKIKCKHVYTPFFI